MEAALSEHRNLADEVHTTMAKGIGGGGKKGKIGKVASQILGMIANSAKG